MFSESFYNYCQVSNNFSLLSKNKNTLEYEEYCKYCLEQWPKQWICAPRPKRYSEIPTKKFKDLFLTMTEYQKKRWSQVEKTQKIDPESRVCLACFKVRQPEDIVRIKKEKPEIIKAPIRRKKFGDPIEEDKKQEVETINPQKDQMLKEGWVGPILKLCMGDQCKSTTAYVKIRAPLTDDEPPIVTYKCTFCKKTNLDYTQ